MNLSPVLNSDRAALSRIVVICGGRLQAVSYHYLPPADDSEYNAEDSRVHGDIRAVALQIADRGTFVVTWAMEGELEGLAVLGLNEPYAGTIDEAVDVTSSDGWRQHIGQMITSVAAASHVSCSGCPDSLWALRVDLPTGSVVVALGTADASVSYMPDELVVTFDPTVASSYRPKHVSASAWGDRLNTA
jgi:hypothetical protein